MKRSIFFFLLLAGCGQSAFEVAKEDGSIAAWETYLRENPEDKHAYLGKAILEELYWEDALAKMSWRHGTRFCLDIPSLRMQRMPDEAAEKCAYRIAEEAN